ncbi:MULTISPECIES: ergothioneine biosynthesis protein EgtB [Filomicrobium]|uniref:Ergothioneine biosynthesis protein EgtB n=1 Tax=Filomicrobium insigne TaxID=418854 RepID=A0A1H0QWA5_9HYPH|nr:MULTISPECIES: ergothioneine biosynthesis protein EgtB [Filomicrobium]MCV0369480.1 ergothioneine biosynthesis protein EgtB [Filomicrobium sp.]SDP21537.1 ergothioneine biosynthesis protein EgtB [Filomicrobium insigne]
MPASPEDSAQRHRFSDTSVSLGERLHASRELSLTLARPLTDEDQTVQAMDDASPTKWHLAHTTWFYEAFVLRNHMPGYQPFSDRFEYCFNSYYETQGPRHPRAHRGLLTRPSAEEVRRYRSHVDEALMGLMSDEGSLAPEVKELIELGINHEQQHQELLLTDILSLFAAQPLRPAYQPLTLVTEANSLASETRWISFDGGIKEVGHDGQSFSYDNELPRHDELIRPFKLAHRCVSNSEWLEFIEDGGYVNPLLWLADGWGAVKSNGWQAPGYWEETADGWRQMTLHGLVPLNPAAPVSHVSYYEADAFARWAGKRLPSEFEWERAAQTTDAANNPANTLGSGTLRPCPASADAPVDRVQQMMGDVWEWTGSAYLPYPGYRPPPGAVGEYNGKFMCSQHVLRGASCVTPDGHSRITYRNFFYPHQRWQFMGLRLAEDA